MKCGVRSCRSYGHLLRLGINRDIGALVEDGVGVHAVSVIHLFGVVGYVSKTKNAVRANDIWNLSSDGVVGLGDHIHSRVVSSPSKLVGEVGLGQVLDVVGANKGVEMSRLFGGPVVQVLLELDGDSRSRLVDGLGLLHGGVTALVDGIRTIASGIAGNRDAKASALARRPHADVSSGERDAEQKNGRQSEGPIDLR